MYYLRTKAAASAIQFTVDKTKLKKANENAKEEGVEINEAKEAAKKEYEEAALICSIQNKDDCLMCGSWFLDFLKQCTLFSFLILLL